MGRHHRKKHTHTYTSGSTSSIIRRIYWKVLLFYFLVAVMGLLNCLIFNDKLTVSDSEFSRMDFLQKTVTYIFKFFLNFPLGIENWFSNNYIATTYLFFVPDSLFITWLLLKTSTHYRRIDKILNFVIVIMFFVMFLISLISIIYASMPHISINY